MIHIQASSALLLSMLSQQVFPSASFYNAAIGACGRSRLWERALGTLRRMPSEGENLAADAVSFGSALAAVEGADLDAGPWEVAHELLGQMRAAGLEPCGLDYGAAMSVTQRARQWRRSFDVLARALAVWAPGRGQADDEAGAASGGAPPITAGASASTSVLGKGAGIIAVSKPASVTTEAALDRLAVQLAAGGAEPVPITSVSRLDIMTSGVLVAALGSRSSAAANVVMAQFAGRVVSKEYLCACVGAPLGPVGATGEVRSRLRVVEVEGKSRALVASKPDGQEARTRFLVLAVRPPSPVDAGPTRPADVATLLLAKPVTGRTHQIRVHFASIGRPLVADSTYSRGRLEQELAWCPRLFLHCRRVALRDLAGDAFVAAEPLPGELAAALQRLGGTV